MMHVRGYRIAVFALVAGLGTAALVQSAAAGTAPVAEGPVPSARLALASSTSFSGIEPVAVKESVAPAPLKAKPAVKAAPRRTAPVVVTKVARTTKPAVAPKPVVTTDGYPWARATTNAYDDWGFTRRQCVSYVAWRLASSGRAISNAGNVWGSALNWDETARRKGVAVSSRPVVGAVAHWNAGEASKAYAPGSSSSGTFVAGGYGHVGYVTAVYGDGTVQVAQYNLMGDRKFSSLRMTAPRFLLFP